MFKITVITLSGVALFFAGVIAFKAAANNPEAAARRSPEALAQRAKDTALAKQAKEIELELYSRSPEARKTRARLILGAQFPGWCRWSTAEMVVRSNGDVYARCNGATFAVGPTMNIGMRFIDN